jgi:hypothetical protein
MEILQLKPTTHCDTTDTLTDIDLEEFIRADLLAGNPELDALDMPSPEGIIEPGLRNFDSLISSFFPPSFRMPIGVVRPVEERIGDQPNPPSQSKAIPLDSRHQDSTFTLEVRRGRPRKEPDAQEDPYTQHRRERNRLAARRCRVRRQAKIEELEAEIEQLRQERGVMMAELIRLGARPSQ